MASVLAVVAAASLLLLHTCPCSAARALTSRLAGSSETAAFTVAPSASEDGGLWRRGTAARAGKYYAWMPPYGGRAGIGAGGVRYLPGWYPSLGKPMLWAAGTTPAAPGAFRAGGGHGQLVRAPHEHDDVTRQEQVALWASLLNPSHKPTTSVLPLPASGEAADAEPEPESSVSAEGTEAMDVPAGGGGGVQIGQEAGGSGSHWP